MVIRSTFINQSHLYLGIAVLLAAVGSSANIAAEDPIAGCTERMKTIHRALVKYEQKNHQWPDHLSDLVPEYLSEPAELRDPADGGTGELGSDEAHADPKYRLSYSYERTSDVSNGLAQPLGPFPKPDISDASWGSWRLINGHMEYFFGDQVPIVRCYHHRPPEANRDEEQDLVLNLTPGGRVYRSAYDWRRHPDSLEFLLRTLERDLNQAPERVLRSWLLWRVDEFLGDETGLSTERHGPRMIALAELLMKRHRELKGEERTSCRMAARLFKKGSNHDRALAALDAAGTFPGAEWHSIIEKQLRGEIYHAAGRWSDEIVVYESLLAERPEVRPYMESLASAYMAAGKPDLARGWRDKADPGRLLVGNAAPEFQVTLVKSGTALSLKSALRDRKALLLDFWFCNCQPCRLTFPFMEELHDRLAAKGLAIVAVNFGDTEDDIAKFARELHVSIPLAVGKGAGNKHSIFQSYRVQSFPTSFLIDASGKILWRGVGHGTELKRELSAVLLGLGFETTAQ